jgi:hypothetical protein
MQWANSVALVLRNLRRAGVLKKSSLTFTVVPLLRATVLSSPLRLSSIKCVVNQLTNHRSGLLMLAKFQLRLPTGNGWARSIIY